MSEAVKAALITGGISMIGIIVTAFLQFVSTRNKLSEEFARQTADLRRQSETADLQLQAKLQNFQAVTNTKIDELTREVREHNNFAKRMPVLEEKAKRTDARLAELERAHTGS